MPDGRFRYGQGLDVVSGAGQLLNLTRRARVAVAPTRIAVAGIGSTRGRARAHSNGVPRTSTGVGNTPSHLRQEACVQVADRFLGESELGHSLVHVLSFARCIFRPEGDSMRRAFFIV